MEHNGMRDVSRRTCFLVAGDGLVRGAWEYENAEVPDVEALLAAAQSL
jgi:hypothetical protein